MSNGRRAVALAGHEGRVADAHAALTDPDPSVRATALGALHRTGALDAQTVAATLVDPSPVVRRRAVTLAVHYPDVDLGAALDDGDATVVEVAAWACGERAGAAPSVVAALARLSADHADALVREAAVAALGAIGDAAGLPAILAATHDRATVRRRAIIALAPFDGPDVDAALARARGDRDAQVRQAAEDLT